MTREDEPQESSLENAESFEDLKKVIQNREIAFDSSQWNEEGIIDSIEDVEKLVSGESDKEGRARPVKIEDAIKMVLERFPDTGDLGILRKKLAELSAE